tara:strand:+ start:2084 stop:2617 length:534 start_codon:yes stop_codon:yes gene_type:complete
MALYKENNSLEVLGLNELQRMFKNLPKELSDDKIWNAFWKKNSEPLVNKAQSLAPKKTGQLSRSIGYFRTKASRRGHGGYVGPRVRGKYAKRDENYSGSNKSKIYTQSGFYGAWIEYGDEVMFGGKGTGSSQPFMKPAYEQTKSIMVAHSLKDGGVVMGKLIKSHTKRTEKYGKFGY